MSILTDRLLVSLQGQYGSQVASQKTGSSANMAGLSQLFIAGVLQPRSAINTNITVSSSGTFDATITVPPNLPAGRHTIQAMENQGSQRASLQFTVPPSELVVDPTALNFVSIEVGRKLSLSVTVGNRGGSNLSWSTTVEGSHTNWLRIQPNTGSIEANARDETIVVTADTNGLQVGTHSATLHIHSDAGDAQIAVRVNVVPHAQGAQQARLNVLQQNLDFGQRQTGQQVQQSVSIANLGNLPLNWLASSDAASAGWLSLDTTSGTVQSGASAQTVQVMVVASSLTAGSYTGSINITSNGGDAIVKVTFTVTELTPTPSSSPSPIPSPSPSPSPSPIPSPSPSPSPTPTPQITVTPISINQSSSNCSQNSDGTYNCSVTVGETAPGNLNWFAPTGIGGTGVSFNPSSGQLTTSKSQQSVAISSIPCSNASFTFTDQNNNTATVVWSSAATPTPTPTPSPTPSPMPTPSPTSPPPPTLTVSPPGITNCPQNSDGSWTCTVTLSLTHGSQGTLNWSSSSDLPGVTFSPPNGTLMPDQAVQVSITIPYNDCKNGNMYFAGQNSNTVDVTWNCS